VGDEQKVVAQVRATEYGFYHGLREPARGNRPASVFDFVTTLLPDGKPLLPSWVEFVQFVDPGKVAAPPAPKKLDDEGPRTLSEASTLLTGGDDLV
jgi:hypothetical protein